MRRVVIEWRDAQVTIRQQASVVRGNGYEAIATFAEISACAENSIGICFGWLRLHECRGTGATARFSEARRDSPREGLRSFRPVVTRCRRRPNRDCRCKARIDACVLRRTVRGRTNWEE